MLQVKNCSDTSHGVAPGRGDTLLGKNGLRMAGLQVHLVHYYVHYIASHCMPCIHSRLDTGLRMAGLQVRYQVVNECTAYNVM